jgi:peroxiredoxin
MDRPEELRKTMDKQHMTYTLLSDSDAKAVKAFGVAFKVDDQTVEKYKGFNIDLEKASGRSHHILPVPSMFIIGTDRIIRFVYSNPDYRVRLAASKVLEAAKSAQEHSSNGGGKK